MPDPIRRVTLTLQPAGLDDGDDFVEVQASGVGPLETIRLLRAAADLVEADLAGAPRPLPPAPPGSTADLEPL